MFTSWLVNAPRRSFMLLVRGYQLFLSAWLGTNCRFTPSCSAYSIQALEIHGAAAGAYLTLRRIARCHPGCAGGHDPVPPVSGTVGSATRSPTPPSFLSRFNFRKKTRT